MVAVIQVSHGVRVMPFHSNQSMDSYIDRGGDGHESGSGNVKEFSNRLKWVKGK